MSETGIAPIRRDEDEKIRGDDGGAALCPDAGIGKQRHGFRFRTAPLMKRPSHPSRVAGFFYTGAKRMTAQMRRNNRVKERTFDSSAKRALCAREMPVLKNYGKNDQMNMNFRDFLRLDK